MNALGTPIRLKDSLARSARLDCSLTLQIIKTLCYADIFDYPLTFGEAWKFLVGIQKVGRKDIETVFGQLGGIVERKDKYFYLVGREDMGLEREKRMGLSRKKLKKSWFRLKLLSLIPTIKLLGISGSLAVLNAKEEDDVDIFIITSKNTLWITRFFVSVFLIATGVKRGRREKMARDKICPNMFVSEDCMEFRGEDKNLFVAHEILQLKVVASRDSTYEKFLLANFWTSEFLPNAVNFERVRKKVGKSTQTPTLPIMPVLNFLILLLDKIFFTAQFAYMEAHMNNEKVKRNIAKFHPVDKGPQILKGYEDRTEYYTWQYYHSNARLLLQDIDMRAVFHV